MNTKKIGHIIFLIGNKIDKDLFDPIYFKIDAGYPGPATTIAINKLIS